MLQAMNTGHEGSMTTVHANTPRDALNRIEQMIGMAASSMSVSSIRSQIASGIQLILQLQRMTDGRRRLTSLSEVTGMEGDAMQMHDIFGFEQNGVNEQGHATGTFYATGVRPRRTLGSTVSTRGPSWFSPKPRTEREPPA